MWYVSGRGELHTGFWWGNLRERDHLESLVVDEGIFKWIVKKQNEVVSCIDVDKDRDMWSDTVHTVIKLRIP
jgi:hypothetical protein